MVIITKVVNCVSPATYKELKKNHSNQLNGKILF